MSRSAIDQACDLGFLCLDRQRLGEAEDAFRGALRQDPACSRAWHGLGNLWLGRGRADDSAEAFRRALVQRPDHPVLVGNLALALHRTGQSGEAERLLRGLLAAHPENYEGIINLGVVLRDLGQWREATRQFEQGLALKPGSPKLRFDLALLRLASGDFTRGWRDYELRWEANGTPMPGEEGIPVWQGEPLAGKRLLLLAEQGFGDTLQFIRYAPLLARQGCEVMLACAPGLVRLMHTVDGLSQASAHPSSLPRADFQVPLMSLPYRCGTQPDTIPADVPYLHAAPAERARWAERLGDHAGKRVGLVWAGAPRPELPWAHETDRRRSLPLSVLAPLGRVAGIRLISLQKGPPAAQLASAPPGLVIEDYMDAVEDFADTAALVANLDLVIAADTAVAHLAGALGVPVWLLSRFDGCWRWLLDRDDSPWYPGLRLFRQTRPGDWASVVAEVAAALER